MWHGAGSTLSSQMQRANPTVGQKAADRTEEARLAGASHASPGLANDAYRHELLTTPTVLIRPSLTIA